MTNENQATASAEAPAAPLPSPGTLLRQARERAGIGAEDLAGQLKLAKGTLEALERDDFAALSEPVYVRGYYRKIAKLLPVSETELIGAYNARNKPAAKAAPTIPRIPLAGGVAAGTSRQHRGQGVGFIVGAAVLGLVLFFVLADRRPTQRLAETPASKPPAAAPAPVETTPGPAPSTLPSQPSAAAASNAPAPQPGATAPGTAPAPAPAAPAASGTVPAAVANQLVLEFADSSFVRIEDNRGKTLAIGLVRAGERSALDGQPPYTVFLGNARNVKVLFNGQPVDFAALVNALNDTARFTVP
jgi:cytoskeleton protein RodZ